MPAYAGLGKRWLRCRCGSREGVGAELELASAVVTGYAPFPRFVPTHVTNFGSDPSALHRVGRGKARGRVQPGSIVQETAAEIDQGIAAAARDDVDHPADGDSGGKMVDGLLQHAIDRTDGVIEDRRPRGQRAPATGFETG